MNILNETEFRNLLAEGGRIVADFFADWCGPCAMLAPVLESLSANHDDVEFVKVNVDESPDLASEYGIDAIPCVICFENGLVTAKSVGFASEQQLEERLGL